MNVAVIWSWLTAHPEDTYMLLIGMLPVLDVIVSAPQYYLVSVVLATSIEMKKHQSIIDETKREMQTERSLNMLKMLNTLQAQESCTSQNLPTTPGIIAPASFSPWAIPLHPPPRYRELSIPSQIIPDRYTHPRLSIMYVLSI